MSCYVTSLPTTKYLKLKQFETTAPKICLLITILDLDIMITSPHQNKNFFCCFWVGNCYIVSLPLEVHTQSLMTGCLFLILRNHRTKTPYTAKQQRLGDFHLKRFPSLPSENSAVAVVAPPTCSNENRLSNEKLDRHHLGFSVKVAW